MNAFFLTQTGSLPMFFHLMRALQASGRVDAAGFYLAGQRFFNGFHSAHPEIGHHLLVKEWEIVRRGLARRPDPGRLREYEVELGDPTLWGAIIGDRRIALGPRCTLRQDYQPRFTHAQMLGIVEEGIITLERAFDELKPEAVFSFICVTFGEYLAYLIAKARGIRYLSLRTVRVENFVTFAPTIWEPSEELIAEYGHRYHAGIEDRWSNEARRFVAEARDGVMRYEGVVPVSRRAMSRPTPTRLPRGIAGLARAERDYWLRGERYDNQAPDPSLVVLYSRLLNPMRAHGVNRALASEYLSAADLRNHDYAFFPLHTEPEFSLAVQGRWFLNQIEVVRNVAQSLPAGWHVVIKEHPVSIGKRPLSYYRKLLAIPNVKIADPGLNSRDLIDPARMVVSISGSIGLEAALRQKPVICFGHCPYEILPSSMVRRVPAFEDLPEHVRDLIANFSSDEAAIVAYVSASMAISERVNVYSTLLGRKGVHVPNVPDQDGRTDLERLTALAIRYLDMPVRHPVSIGEPLPHR